MPGRSWTLLPTPGAERHQGGSAPFSRLYGSRRRAGTDVFFMQKEEEKMKKVAILMGSDSDFGVMSKAVSVLKEFEIPVEVHVYSAHRTPEKVAEFASNAKDNGFGVIIAGAGMAAALAGVVAGHTTLPVIGVPLKSNALEGVDALLSTVMMPSGIPVATVAIDGSKNAAYLAAQILAIGDEELAKKVLENRQKQSAAVLVKDQELQEKVQAL